MSRGAKTTRLGAALVLALALAGLLVELGDSDAAPPFQAGNVVLQRVGRTSHGAITRINTGRRVVALSIDDGPDPRFTPIELATLKSHGAHGTFFVVGTAATRHPELIAAELAGGHELANHTLDHPHLSQLGAAATRREIDRGRQAMMAAGAPEPRLFRAPFGEFTDNVLGPAARRGELLVGWSLTVERALDGRSVTHAVTWLMHRVKPGTIILAHDGLLDRTRTTLALPLLLDQLHRRGYSVITVSDLLARGGNAAARRLLALGITPSPGLKSGLR